MTPLRSSLHFLLCTIGFSLYGAVPAPSFTPTQAQSLGGPSVVKTIGSRTAPKLANGADSGQDDVVPVNFSGFSGTWDIAAADHDSKKVVLSIQDPPSGSGGFGYTHVPV